MPPSFPRLLTLHLHFTTVDLRFVGYSAWFHALVPEGTALLGGVIITFHNNSSLWSKQGVLHCEMLTTAIKVSPEGQRHHPIPKSYIFP